MIWKNVSANAHFTKQFMQCYKKTFSFIILTKLMLEPTCGFRGQLGSLSESRHISVASTPKFKTTYNATVGLHGQSPDPQNEAIGTKFRHLVVDTNQTPYKHSITKQPHSHITGQNRPQTLGIPTRYYAPLQVDPPSESKTLSTSSEEALKESKAVKGGKEERKKNRKWRLDGWPMNTMRWQPFSLSVRWQCPTFLHHSSEIGTISIPCNL
ncbi:hypothetical protein M9H77_25351 [Catharanthus roseus]|uniref:Uncharacterized protein n=1 Tax=Catharanthus roseus TaxID=4058 RepID=A0ACC0AAT8_CATRO|nr:hypothetical protein M9H77_25351 [Catharanthus roseus]